MPKVRTIHTFNYIAALKSENVGFFARLVGKQTAEDKAAKWLLGREGQVVLKNAKETEQYKFPKTDKDKLFKKNIDNLALLRAARLREKRIKQAFLLVCIILLVVDLSFFMGTLTAAYFSGQLAISLVTTLPGLSTVAAGALGALGVANVVGFALPLLNRAINNVLNAILFVPKWFLGYSNTDSELRVALTVAEIRGTNYQQGKEDEIILKTSWLESSRNQVIGSAVMQACKVIAETQHAKKPLAAAGSSNTFVPGYAKKANDNKEKQQGFVPRLKDQEKRKPPKLPSERASPRTKKS